MTPKSQAGTAAPAPQTPRRILHVLNHSQPHRDGYAMRSYSILQFQRRGDLEPVALTSPKHGPSPAAREEICGVVHHRTDAAAAGQSGRLGRLPFVREWRQVRAVRRQIEAVARAERVELIHAHSPSLNGVPAAGAARRLGLPFVYEVRAFWEDAAVDQGRLSEGSALYRLSQRIESDVLRRADAVTVICEGIRDVLIARGVSAEKITVIPNGVDLERYAPRAADPAVAERFGLRGRVVFGFIGSFYHFEGLTLLLESFARLREWVPGARLMLVGGGDEEAALRDRSDALGLGDDVVFTGSVPSDQVLDFYSVMDVLIYPRLSMPLTDRVTPLKPLEAMAMAKVVVGSDVGGLKELVNDGETGLLFPAGDAEALARTLRQVAESRDLWRGLGERARQHVRATREWSEIVAGYRAVYGRARVSAARAYPQ
jgi:PEP-CTERM/exosortase A-associated glycosyltransferase